MSRESCLWNKRKRIEGLQEKVRILRGAANNLFVSQEAKDDANAKADEAEAEIALVEGQIEKLERGE